MEFYTFWNGSKKLLEGWQCLQFLGLLRPAVKDIFFDPAINICQSTWHQYPVRIETSATEIWKSKILQNYCSVMCVLKGKQNKKYTTPNDIGRPS
jgi:hypothetical protein